ncbi:MAG: FapA family protein [Leptospiraceae bacterium]|nr:DUF342 domain-containing protein [Leptospiraceae bacterium]MCK6380940.1 FapA family protein [Leptospiraceae bacterium]NUM40004.1 DUF342 domain-containing protein [Leptospiraceae bacterium]
MEDQKIQNIPGIGDFNAERALSLSISEDTLSAELTISPVKLFGHPLSLGDLQDFLDKSGIAEDRTDYEAIRISLTKLANRGPKPTDESPIKFIVATGVPATPGVDGFLKFYHPRAKRVVIAEDGSADYRNTDRYIHVKKDEKVATLFEGIAGKQGVSVFGKPIYPPSINRPKLSIGKNVYTKNIPSIENSGHIYIEHYSVTDGVIYLTDNSVSVSPELEIQSDVGLSTGNVKYEGSVRVKGSIESGSNVFCTGSLIVGGNIESDEVTVSEGLEVKGGIKVKGRRAIKIGGDLKAKFIENSVLEVDGDIILEGSVLNSKIYCLGNVILNGPSASVIGSEIIAYGGVSVLNLGSLAGLEAVVELGFHFKNEKSYKEGIVRLQALEKEVEELLPKVQQIKRAVMAARGNLDEEKKQKFKEFFDSYQEKAKKANLMAEQIESLKINRYSQEAVTMVVRGMAFPNSVIKYRRQIEKFTVQQSSFMLKFFPGQDKAVQSAFIEKKVPKR